MNRDPPYTRFGASNLGTAQELLHVLQELRRAGMRGLILDLRWSPGGLRDEAVAVASIFLNGGVIAASKDRHGALDRHTSIQALGFVTCPMAVLINGETSGGAELIAAALQDHKRAVIAGQRSLGKGTIQGILSLQLPSLPGASFRLTTATLLRPNGKNLNRFPESKPTDDWGVEPDPQAELRLSPDLTRQLREWWQLQILRPGTNNEVLPLDLPENDPQGQAALKLLLNRKK
jgi:carboxyl-terminal processing protease